jgi:alpha-mannosidase
MLHPRAGEGSTPIDAAAYPDGDMTRRVAVVAHTHWDREWYAPYEHFRVRLADVLDELLGLLEGDPSFRCFLLDGQMAMVDDYLDVRPEAADRIRGLAEHGRLALGPWYVPMDEFCVSAETIVRNLQLGLRRADELGGAMPVGYLPDMFGHIGQMPQLLRLAGFEHAVVWRGVPASVDRTAFWWTAPDGSTVRAEYLPVGYANGAYLPADPEALLRRLAAHEDELGPLLGDASTPILLMNGADHQRPQPHLPGLLAAANRLQRRFDFQQATLAEYLAAAPTTQLPRWCGELRSGARSNLLMGVLSNRVDLKGAAASAERLLERWAEPLATLWLPKERWPAGLLSEAWLAMVRNAAHDSVGGCSADAVGRAVRQRYDVAAALAREVIDQALALVELASDTAGAVVVNPAPGPADATVEVTLAGTEPVPDTQVLARLPAGVEERAGTGADFGRLLGELRAAGWLADGQGVDARIEHDRAGLDVVIVADASRRPTPQLASVMAEAWAAAGAGRRDPLRVRVERQPSQRVAARVRGVPGYGWAAFRPAPLGAGAVHAGRTWLENALVRVDLDPGSGTFAIHGVAGTGNGAAGLGRLVDDGEEGDTYNHSAPRRDLVVQYPERVELEAVESGPVRATIRMIQHFTWPAGVVDGRRAGRRPVAIASEIQLHAGEDLVRVAIHFDNPSRDHRLRAWFPLPRRADDAVGGCAFGAVRRGPASGGPHEPPLATYPGRHFVAAGGLTVTHEGLLEHELVDDGAALALTLLRATGVLSRPAPPARPNPAGPSHHLEGPQLVGPHLVRYAVAVGAINPWRLADTAWLAPRVVVASGTGRLPASGSRLVISGAEVSALQRRADDGAIEVRVFNPADQPATVEMPDHSGWLVDLRGRPLRRFSGRFGLRPWEVATACLDADSLDY